MTPSGLQMSERLSGWADSQIMVREETMTYLTQTRKLGPLHGNQILSLGYTKEEPGYSLTFFTLKSGLAEPKCHGTCSQFRLPHHLASRPMLPPQSASYCSCNDRPGPGQALSLLLYLNKHCFSKPCSSLVSSSLPPGAHSTSGLRPTGKV